MEIENTLENVNTNIDSFQEFKIAATPLMFKLLSSDIYTDKIRAVIRELSTNAVDSMIEAGTIDTYKYQVTIPSVLSPVFKIRDFGTGLDEEGIKRVYTYGDSSRNKSNLFVGAFGIGSKSPFAYTKTGFDIVSWCNGKRYHYNASLIEGVPQIFKVDERESDEPNGVEITIAVDKYDCSTFQERAEQFYAWFDYKPDINIPIDEAKIKYPEGTKKIYETDSFLYMSENHGWRSSHIMIKMGGILYEIPSIFKSIRNNYIDDYKTLIIKAPIGRYALQPSREQIDGTDKNKERLTEDLETFITVTIEQIKGRLKAFFEDTTLSYNQKALKIRSDSGFKEIVNADSYVRSTTKFKEAFTKTIKELSPETYAAYERVQVMESKKPHVLSTGHNMFINPMEIMVLEDYAHRCKRRKSLYSDKFLVRDVPNLKGQPDLAKLCNNEALFSHNDLYDNTDPAKPVWLLKAKPELIPEIKKIAMEELGMFESQIVIASEWNKKWNEEHKPVKTKTGAVVKLEGTVKCFKIEGHSSDVWVRDRKLSDFNPNEYVYYYDGRYTDVSVQRVADIQDILYQAERAQRKDVMRTDVPIWCVNVRNKKSVEASQCKDAVVELKKIIDNTTYNILPNDYEFANCVSSKLRDRRLSPYCKLTEACAEMWDLVKEQEYRTYCTLKELARYLSIDVNSFKTVTVRSPLLDQWMIDYEPIYTYMKEQLASRGYVPGYVEDFMRLELFIYKFGKDKAKDVFGCNLW